MKITQKLPKAQVAHMKRALLIAEQILSLDNNPDQQTHYDIFDLKTLQGLMNYDVTVSMTPEQHKKFTADNGIDFPMYVENDEGKIDEVWVIEGPDCENIGVVSEVNLETIPELLINASCVKTSGPYYLRIEKINPDEYEIAVVNEKGDEEVMYYSERFTNFK